jgi:phenylalanyl-tRNA synthetase alpha chain
MGKYIKIQSEDEIRLRNELGQRTDFEAKRMQRYMDMPDLSRTPGSPLFEMVKRVKEVSFLKDFDEIVIPEILPTTILFDLFDFKDDHPARSKSDTYYVDDKNVLRTHDTVMWYYYLNHQDIKERNNNKEDLGVICYGKVYRKDEIDSRHMNTFHQLGAVFLQDDSKGIMPIEKLKEVLSEIVESIFGKDIEYRFLDDTFPYTDPSLQIEVMMNGKWIEIMGGGMPKKSVLQKMGLTGYNGWAFGFGLERLGIISMKLPDIRLFWSDDERVKKQLNLGQQFVEVSKFPSSSRDISFVVSKDFVPNDYFDMIREIGGDLIEEVALTDKYENEAKFGKDKISYTYHIVYRSLDKTLTSEEIDTIQQKIYSETKERYNADLR